MTHECLVCGETEDIVCSAHSALEMSNRALQEATAKLEELRATAGPLVEVWQKYGISTFMDESANRNTLIDSEDVKFYNTAARVAERLHSLSLGDAR